LGFGVRSVLVVLVVLVSAGDFTVGAPRLKAASRSSSFTRCYSLRCAREGRPELKEER
jgi:hypothetical protein